MAIAHQQTQTANPGNAQTVATINNFAVGSGTDRTLVAAVVWYENEGQATPPVVSSVVFNTTEGFTEGYTNTYTFATTRHVTASIWYLDNPTNATADVVATINRVSTNLYSALCSEYTGANNGIEAGNPTGASANDANPDVAITSVNSDSMLIYGAANQTDQTWTQDAGTTERGEDAGGAIAEEAGTAALQTVGGTWGASVRWSAAVIEIKAAAGNGGRTTLNTDPYGLGIESGMSRTFKIKQ